MPGVRPSSSKTAVSAGMFHAFGRSTCFRSTRSLSGVVASAEMSVASNFLAGDGDDYVAGVNKARQHDDHPIGLQAIRGRGQVLDVVHRVDELDPVENLAVFLPAQQLNDVPRVA